MKKIPKTYQSGDDQLVIQWQWKWCQSTNRMSLLYSSDSSISEKGQAGERRHCPGAYPTRSVCFGVITLLIGWARDSMWMSIMVGLILMHLVCWWVYQMTRCQDRALKHRQLKTSWTSTGTSRGLAQVTEPQVELLTMVQEVRKNPFCNYGYYTHTCSRYVA